MLRKPAEKGSEAFAGLLTEVKTTRRRRPSASSSSATTSVTPPSSGISLLPPPQDDAEHRHQHDHQHHQQQHEDPFNLPVPGLDDDAVDQVMHGASPLIVEQQPPPPQARAPSYASPALAALVGEYGAATGRGAWGQAARCLEQLPREGEKEERPRALAEMAGALLASLPARGWRLAAVAAEEGGKGKKRRALQLLGHGGASAAPERLKAEVLAPLRAAALAVADGCEEGEDEEDGSGGAALVLALRLEAAAATGAAVREAEALAWAERAACLVVKQPGLVSLHCCGLALAALLLHHHQHQQQQQQQQEEEKGTGTSQPPISAAAVLDCLLAILALSLPATLEVEATMRGLSGKALLLPAWDVDEPPYLVLPPALAARPR